MNEVPLEVLRPRQGSGRIVGVESDQVTVDSSVASPPGSTLEASAAGVKLQIKVRSCKRDPAVENYRIEGRFVNLSRADREKLAL
jgi:hypothetical protein